MYRYFNTEMQENQNECWRLNALISTEQSNRTCVGSFCMSWLLYLFEQNEIDELNNIQNYDEVNN